MDPADPDVTRPMDDAEPERVSMRPARRSIGRYRLSYEIASGGQATVYVGVAEGPSGFEKVVAVKILHRHFTKDPASVAQFLDEARLAARLTHPNVCGVMDFGIDDGDHFLVMDFIPGVTVAKLLGRAAELDAEGRLDRARWGTLAALIVEGIAGGLHAVHDLRDANGRLLHVVHRDVAPKNVILGFDGSVRLMDFGIAKHDERSTTASVAGTIKGTASYLAPEHARGEPIDARADVWALGVVAWELFGVRRLFKRPTHLETMLAVMNEPIPPLAALEPTWTRLDAAFGVALARDAAKRTDDARDLASGIGEAVGRASAADLAAFVREVLPHAEVESRTLVELARHSVGDVPEASEAVEARKRHLAAIALHQSARVMLADLEHALAADDADPSLDERLVECRMTLLQAQRAWPADHGIRTSLDAVLRLSVRREVGRENVAAARALAGRLGRPDEILTQEIDALGARLAERRAEAERLERLAREGDLRIGLRARVGSLVALLLGSIAVAVLAFTQAPDVLTHTTLLRIAGVQLAATVVGALAFWRSLAANSVGRRFAALVVVVALTGLVHRALGAWLGVTPTVVLATDLVRHAFATAAAGLLVPRTAWAGLVPTLALALTLALPEETARIVSISAVLTLVSVTVLVLVGLGPKSA